MIFFLKLNGFYKFAYLTKNGTELITDFNDHYKYCNIVCINILILINYIQLNLVNIIIIKQN